MAQTAGLPAKQTITASFVDTEHRIIIQTNNLSPFVPLEIKGTWPDSVYKLTIHLLSTKSTPDLDQLKNNPDGVRAFNFGDVQAFSKSQTAKLIDLAGQEKEAKKVLAKNQADTKQALAAAEKKRDETALDVAAANKKVAAIEQDNIAISAKKDTLDKVILDLSKLERLAKMASEKAEQSRIVAKKEPSKNNVNKASTDSEQATAKQQLVEDKKEVASGLQKYLEENTSKNSAEYKDALFEKKSKILAALHARTTADSLQMLLSSIGVLYKEASEPTNKTKAVIEMDAFYQIEDKVRDPNPKASADFTVLLPALQLRRYYGVQIIAEGKMNRLNKRPILYATEKVVTSTDGVSQLGDGPLPILYSGDLENVPHERFIPYSAVGAGFLGIAEHPAYPFLTTSIGLIVTTRPIYTGVKTPFIHRNSSSNLVGNWILNRGFFSGGITTASLTYRGRALATSAVKGTVGTGVFVLPGLALAFDCSFGGTANYNSAFDNRTKPFFMLGGSIRFTGQVTEIFKSNLGNSLPQASK